MHQGPFKIETKLGNVWITATQANHIYVDFGSNLNVDKEGPENFARRGPVTIRGVKYGGSLHLFRWNGASDWTGAFHLGRQSESEWERGRSLYMNRLSAKRYADSRPSDTARRVAVEVIVPLVNAWVRDNAPVLEAAEREHLQRMRENRQKEINELREKIAKLEAEIKELERGL